MAPRSCRALFAVPVLLALGCEPADDSRPPVAVTDSAGVQIVQVDSAYLARLVESDLQTVDPQISFPGPEYADSLFLNDVRSVDRNGAGWAILQGSEPFVLTIGDSSAGQWGARGEGPGDLTDPQVIWFRPEGGVGVWDTRLRRLSYFGNDGQAGEVVTIRSEALGEAGLSSAIQPLASMGSSLLGVASYLDRPQPSAGINDIVGALVMIDPSGTARVLNDEPRLLTQWGGVVTSRGGIAIDQNPPFGFRTVAAASDDFAYVITRAGEIEVLNREGTTSTLIRTGLPQRPPSEAEIDATIRERVAFLPESARPPVAENLETITATNQAIPLADYLVAGLTRVFIWPSVQLAPGPTTAVRTVLELNLQTLDLTAFRAPAEFRPMGTDDTRVWGILRDELGVESLGVFIPPADTVSLGAR